MTPHPDLEQFNRAYSILPLYVQAGLESQGEPSIEPESSEYVAYRHTLNNSSILFRCSKITPTKLGQFVTLWKRPFIGAEIAPFDIEDGIDLVVIAVREGSHCGQFIFNQKTLVEKDIFSQNAQGGKRAFRIYPPWVTPESAQALKTQKWQQPYFLDLSVINETTIMGLKTLFNKE